MKLVTLGPKGTFSHQASKKAHKKAEIVFADNIDAASGVMDAIVDEPKYQIEKEALETIQHLREVADGKVDIDSAVTGWVDEYRKAAQALFDSDFETALGLFIGNIMKDRSADNDGARKAAVAIFSLLSDLHPTAKAYRRRFSMSLY